MNNSIVITLWGRELKMDVIFQNFPGEDIIENQRNTLELIPKVDFSVALDELKKYIITHNSDEMAGLAIDNVFRFVMPRRLLITRDHEKRVFAVMCNYRFDMEHGLAIVFENEQYKEIGPQDIVL